MSKIAVLFAGQGAQKTGMGRALYEGNPAAREIFDRAEKVSPGLRDMCFAGSQEQLNQTIHTQPCVYTVDAAAYAAFESIGVPMDAAAGFSLGEYAALACSGVFTFEEGLRIVQKRAGWMQEAAEKTGGGMAAVLGKTAAEVDAIVAGLQTGGILQAVNYNCPGQTVVAGDEENLAKFLAHCKENRIKAVRLPVGGAFHSRAMEHVSGLILDFINSMDFKTPICPVYANALARPYTTGAIKEVLARQTSSPVYFEQTLANLLQEGFDTFVEVGPGNTLSGFVKRMGREDIAVYNISDMASLEQAADGLKEK